jgi:uncharacterized protein (DUF305 family)
MVNSFANVYPNLNQLYMAGIMTIPMIFIELGLMGEMYHNKKLNSLIIVFNLVLFIALLFFVRKQTGISDKQFLKSMIPHHAAALLMCEQTQLQDPELKELCKNIMLTQQSEINFMKAKLKAY